MRLLIHSGHSTSEGYTTFSHPWVGVVDLSNLQYLQRLTPKDEAHFISNGLYPWYGICGNIISIQEIES
jgi:hypothetical protein